MNIRSLLLGSAVALLASTGAYAADPVKVVAEPEPAEYVKICDVYGTGYYYIPGTEVCLKIGGLIRYEIQYVEPQDGWDKLARIELGFDAKQETEYGTLWGHILLRGNVDSGAISSNSVGVQEAWIDLGGLQMGMEDTLWDYGMSGESDENGGDRVHYIGYTFSAGSGMTFTVRLEEEGNAGSFAANPEDRDWMPNIVARVDVKQSWGSITASLAYDDEALGFLPGNQDDEWAAKAVLTVPVNSALTLQAMATYNSGNSFYTPGGGTGFNNASLAAVWGVGGQVAYKVNSKLTLTLGANYWNDLFSLGETGSAYTIAGVVDYKITSNFEAKLNIEYRDSDYLNTERWEGFLRFNRTF